MHHVLLIQTDQWPAFALSMLGNPNVKTPHLDHLVESGQAVLFEQCVCQSPICLPSRVSMLSGQYPSTNQQFGFTGLTRRNLPWLPRHLQQHGIATGAFGKFHVACVGDDAFGFDRSCPMLPEEEDLAVPKDAHYRQYCEQHGIHWPTDQMHGNDHRNRIALPSMAAQLLENKHKLVRQSCMSDVPLEHSLERWTPDRALDFIREKAITGESFFTWLSFTRPHHPQTVPAEWWDLRRPDELVLERMLTEEELDRHGPAMRQSLGKNSIRNMLGEVDFRYLLASYYTLIQGIDKEIGRVIEQLKALGIDEQTSIIFTADHGDEAGHHGLYLKHRDVCSTALTQVPLIIRPAQAICPKGPTHNRRLEPVQLVDLAPTICELFDCPGMDSPDGVSLKPALLDDASLDPHRSVFCEDIEGRMILHDQWMLAFYAHDDRHSQLYDLQADPGQYCNRYADEEMQDKRIDLKRQLIGFLSQCQYGTYTDADVAFVQRAMNPNDPTIPLHTWCTNPTGHSIDQCRCGLFWHGEGEKLFVPFFDNHAILYFQDKPQDANAHMQYLYPTTDQAMPCDHGKIELILNAILCHLINQTRTVSILKHHPPFPKENTPTHNEPRQIVMA
ncbi:MAG: hypothetical protein CMJ19_07445 [Phycisphaeraceae bacterium]|nr:hypothetical protein [Phycisphaeraceae bacterium]